MPWGFIDLYRSKYLLAYFLEKKIVFPPLNFEPSSRFYEIQEGVHAIECDLDTIASKSVVSTIKNGDRSGLLCGCKTEKLQIQTRRPVYI
jgi:hypothetical protein